MKDRFTLLFIILLIWLFLILMQELLPVGSKLFIVTGIVVLYTVYMNAVFSHNKRRSKKRPPKLDMDYQPYVTIIIPAHNEEFVIENTVENVLNIDYDKFNVIVIDDRSTDNTAKVLKNIENKYSDKVKCIIRDKDAFPGKSAVLNEAIAETDCEVVCIFDADTKVKVDFLKAMLPFLSPDDVGAVQARKIVINKETNFLTRCQNNEYTLDNHFQLGRDSIRGAVELRGNGQLIKKEALVEVGGWNNYTITDDLDLSTKLHLHGWDVRYCPASEVYEEGILSFLPLLRQRRRWVEGSIRRYLDYFFEMLTSDTISFRAGFDMIAYVLEFVLPVLMFVNWVIETCKFIKGYENHLLSTTAVASGVGLFFVIGLVYSLRKYDKLSLHKSLKQAVETGIYMIVIWTPIVTFIVLKILFTKRSMDWDKTPHGMPPTLEKAQQPAEAVEYQEEVVV
jgi:1,2-diacylglycerol 3-beta-glucosyltransferase